MKNIFKENKNLKEENKELKIKVKELENELLKAEDSYEEIIKRKSTYLIRKYEAKIKREKELNKICKNLENRLNLGITKIPDYDITDIRADVEAYLKLLDYKKGE